MTTSPLRKLLLCVLAIGLCLAGYKGYDELIVDCLVVDDASWANNNDFQWIGPIPPPYPGYEKTERFFRRKGDYFVGEGKKISVAEIEKFIRIIENSDGKCPEEPDLRELGLTARFVDRRTPFMMASCSREFPDLSVATVEKHRHLFQFANVSMVAKQELRGCCEWDYGQINVRLRLGGPFGKAMRLKSHGLKTPWMLPWTVQANGKTWKTYSITVPETLAALVGNNGPSMRFFVTKEMFLDQLLTHTVQNCVHDNSSDPSLASGKPNAPGAKRASSQERRNP